jgi:hypothetical protein
MQRTGELVGWELKDSDGKTYFIVYIVEDNKKFFRNCKKDFSSNKKWKFVDKDQDINKFMISA